MIPNAASSRAWRRADPPAPRPAGAVTSGATRSSAARAGCRSARRAHRARCVRRRDRASCGPGPPGGGRRPTPRPNARRGSSGRPARSPTAASSERDAAAKLGVLPATAADPAIGRCAVRAASDKRAAISPDVDRVVEQHRPPRARQPDEVDVKVVEPGMTAASPASTTRAAGSDAGPRRGCRRPRPGHPRCRSPPHLEPAGIARRRRPIRGRRARRRGGSRLGPAGGARRLHEPVGPLPKAMRSRATGTTTQPVRQEERAARGPAEQPNAALPDRRQASRARAGTRRARSRRRARPAPSSPPAAGSGIVTSEARMVATNSGGRRNSPVKARKSALRLSGSEPASRPGPCSSSRRRLPSAQRSRWRHSAPSVSTASSRTSASGASVTWRPSADRRVESSRSSVSARSLQPPDCLERRAPHEHPVAAQLGGAVGRPSARTGWPCPSAAPRPAPGSATRPMRSAARAPPGAHRPPGRARQARMARSRKAGLDARVGIDDADHRRRTGTAWRRPARRPSSPGPCPGSRRRT